MALIIQFFILGLQLLLLGAVVAFLVMCTRRLWRGGFQVPFVPTPHEHLRTIAATLDIATEDTVLDLGSGDGRFLLHCVRIQPSATYVGIEHNALLHLLAKTRKFLAGNPPNVHFIHGDFYKADFSSAQKIYGYLLPSVMRDLEPLLRSSFQGRFASRAFEFANKKSSHIVQLSDKAGLHGEHLLYVYDF